MSQKLPVNNFEWIEATSQFNEGFIKNYDEESDEDIFFDADVQYPENLHNLHNKKFKKLVANLHDQSEYVIHIRNRKQELNHGLVFKKFIE